MSKTIIIAEAGVNHNGDMNIARRLVDVAVDAGVDIVKFQTFKAEKLVTQKALKADYQVANMQDDSDLSQYKMLKKLELDVDAHQELLSYCNSKGIQFLSTAFDLDSIDLLDELGLPFFKIPSGEITNLIFLEKIASKGKPVVMSTGMANLGEIEDALDVLYTGGLSQKDITVLHCNTEYPTPMQDVNLRAMQTINNVFKVGVGYSDHTTGIEVSIAAVAMGAICIEKHFTLSREMEGPDHRASLEPNELADMVKGIRNIEMALGNGIKKPSTSEYKNIKIARKSIIAKQVIKEGDVFTLNNLDIKRPGDGISPMLINQIIGMKAIRGFEVDETIQLK